MPIQRRHPTGGLDGAQDRARDKAGPEIGEHNPWTIGWEERPWDPADGRMSGRYRAALVPAIADLKVRVDDDATVAATGAVAEIARFDTDIDVRFAPFASLLLRSESAASSQIEQLTARAKAILMAEAGDTSRRNATIIASNTGAMNAALALADNPSTAAIIEIHRALLEASNPRIVGQWRDEQVWIGGRRPSPHDAEFVPPHHSRVPEGMEDLVAFMRRNDLDPFIQAMVAHAQFETIHPFPDGNGRTGRALIHAHLRQTGVTRHVIVPISAGLLADTRHYFDALGAYRDGDVSPVVALAADAAHRAIDNGRQLAADVDHISASWREATAKVRSHSVLHRIVAELPSHPVLDIAGVEERFGVSNPAASRAVWQLVELGVLSRANAGLRFRKFIAHDIADALDRFADRVGRRSTPR